MKLDLTTYQGTDRRDDHGGEGTEASRPPALRPSTASLGVLHRSANNRLAEQTAVTQRTAAKEQAAAEQWQEKSAESRWIWQEYQRKWPSTDRTPADRPGDPGSWRGSGDRSLGGAANSRSNWSATASPPREEDKISPALRRRKPGPRPPPDRLRTPPEGRDRIKEKACDTMNESDLSPEEAVSIVADTIRYTFQYRESHYTQGVWSDIGRLKEHGFELHKLKNSWSGDQYKGLNSQWIDPDTGQRFEVQFHTRISFEARQPAHRRLRAAPRPSRR